MRHISTVWFSVSSKSGVPHSVWRFNGGREGKRAMFYVNCRQSMKITSDLPIEQGYSLRLTR